jgi:hypothetical protein
MGFISSLTQLAWILVSIFINQLQAFIVYVKVVSDAYAATFNGWNIVGIALSYAIESHSHHLNNYQNMHEVFIGTRVAYKRPLIFFEHLSSMILHLRVEI